MSSRVQSYSQRPSNNLHGYTRSDGSVVQAGNYWSDLRSPFSELRTVGVGQLIELKSTYGLSALRDIQTTAGSATITHTGSEFKLSTTASGSDSATLDSAERGRYVPGYAVEGGIGIRRPTVPSGSQTLRWGLFDNNDGFFFEEDTDGFSIVRRSGGTDNRVRQASWNNDALDGNGPSGLSFNLTDGHIFQITYTWYGYGVIEYKIVVMDSNERQEAVTVHRERADGGVSIENPNLPVRAQATNGGTASALDLFVGGRRQHVLGKYLPNRRITSERRLSQGSIGTTFLPTVSFRRKADVSDGAFFESVSVKMEGFDILSDSDLVWQLRTGTSLTNASWGTPTDHSASETALEADTSATAVSGGEVLDSGLINGSGGFQPTDLTSGEPLNFDFVARDPVSLVVRRVSGTGGAASTVMRTREEW